MKRLSVMAACIVAVIGICATLAGDGDGNESWRMVLGFDVTATGRDQRAELGNNRIVAATWVSGAGWEFGVFNYPLKKHGDNLLCPGQNLHGIQPWMAYAWTKHNGAYPDAREILYDEGNSRLKIVLVDCETRKVGDNAYEFVKGRIEVFHKP